VKTNLKKITDLEAENGSISQIENSQAGIDTLILNIEQSLMESMKAFENLKEIIIPGKNEMEMIKDKEMDPSYMKLEFNEMIITREKRNQFKGDKFVENELIYDTLEEFMKKEEVTGKEKTEEEDNPNFILYEQYGKNQN
jgi:hypothetical protein